MPERSDGARADAAQARRPPTRREPEGIDVLGSVPLVAGMAFLFFGLERLFGGDSQPVWKKESVDVFGADGVGCGVAVAMVAVAIFIYRSLPSSLDALLEADAMSQGDV
jgi:hypothetical protein